MRDPHIDPYSDRIPLGYLISFRAYGTWLHGDSRGSIDRFHNRYLTPYIPLNEPWHAYNERMLKLAPVKLNRIRRAAIDNAISETCELRKWRLHAANVRTNHVHVVVSASCDPEIVLRAFKANATRKMRESGCWTRIQTPWARKGSKRWLWTYDHLQTAIAYVQKGQGVPL
jgi:REP element-mobilizing transposase RayT